MNRTCIFYLLFVLLGLIPARLHAQIRFNSSNQLTFGDTKPYNDTFKYYDLTIRGNIFVKGPTAGHFLQIDTNPSHTRLAGQDNQVVFYNSRTETFNSIQVDKVYNYSDARAKYGVTDLSRGLDIVLRLRSVKYNFRGNESRYISLPIRNEFTNNNKEIGLLAQEVEKILPNLVFTDNEGKKLVDYTSLIPVLIDAIQSLQAEIEDLKASK